MNVVHVDTPGGSYPIHIGPGRLDVLDQSIPADATAIAVVTNPTVAALYGERAEAALARTGKRVLRIELPDGEAYKDWQTGLALRSDMRTGFTFAGIPFEEYFGEASVGTTTRSFIAEGESHACPDATVDTFSTYFAPADFNETVNTLGQPLYAKQEPRKFDRGTDLHTQSNPLPMCHRPALLVKVTMS